MPEVAQPADAWQTAVENRLTSTDQHIVDLGKKIDKCFLFGMAAVFGIGGEVFYLFNTLNDKLTDLRLALGVLTP